MRIALDPADRRTLALAGLVLVLLLSVTLFVGSDARSGGEVPTTYSSSSKGAKALFLLLQESGYQVERWERRFRDLPAPKGHTLVIAEPNGVPLGADASRLRTFVEHGGRVIVTGPLAGVFLPEVTVTARPWIYTWKRARGTSFSPIVRAAPEITLSPTALWKSGQRAQTLYAVDEGAVVVRFPLGSGEVVWWASATPLTNAGLREPGNLEFVLAHLGAPGSGRILFDESFHGFGRRTQGITDTPLKWVLMQCALLAVAVLVTYARRSGPVLPPPRESRLWPLEFVHTLGSVYEKAGAASVAVDVSYQRFRYWAGRHLGIASNATVDTVVRAARARGLDDPRFGQTLREVEAARHRPDLGAKEALHLVRALRRYAAVLRLFPLTAPPCQVSTGVSDGSRSGIAAPRP